MATDPAQTPFARDLGYLGGFFDKLEEHAATLEATAGERLRTLIAEERRRWDEIIALLGNPQASRPNPSPEPRPEAPAPAPEAAPAPRLPADRSFTVGPLKRR